MNLLLVVTFATVIHYTNASAGDRSAYYQKCLEKCILLNCTDDDNFVASQKQPLYLSLTFWTCGDECKYQCMWKTVDIFHENNLPTPQFHGKWPFVRIFGIQEPASAAFSLLNLYQHLRMIKIFRQEVRPDSPFYWLWHFFCWIAPFIFYLLVLHELLGFPQEGGPVEECSPEPQGPKLRYCFFNMNVMVGIQYLFVCVCCHAWFWSTIFHSRDFPLTELLDYACAFSIVLVNCYVMLIRLLKDKVPRFVIVTISTFFLAFFINHVIYLSQSRFDYGYNMELNLIVGTFTAICWFGWCIYNRVRQFYVWKCAIYVALTGVVLLLEILDKPPFFYVIDSHSLWHLSTAPLIVLLYSFAIDDCQYVRRKMMEKERIDISYKRM